MSDVRWKQRFQNFTKAYQVLLRTANLKNLSEAERGGLIQYYEMVLELSWKLMQDYLQYQGYNVKGPKDTIKQAFQYEMIEDGVIWVEALEDRNLLTHTYSEDLAIEATNKIKSTYLPMIEQLNAFFKNL